jgi:hypothetical protein
MIEKRDALGDMERMVERQIHHRGAEPDAMRRSRRHGERHFRHRHGLPPAGMMLADAELVETELVGQMDE